MKIKFAFILSFCSTLLFSQEFAHIISDTRLYTSNKVSAPILGYFKYGAYIQLLSANENGWYKIKADNTNEGFVPAKYVTKSYLSGNDKIVIDKENPIVEGGDDYYGSAHLFVIVAGLKTRLLPDKTSKLKEILTCGEPVAVNYVPVSPEEWVNISGSFNTEYAKYVQRKYLGNRPNFDELIKQFDKLEETNIQERKTISERLVELAWNSEKSNLPIAYSRYYKVAKQLNDEKIIAETELNMILANKLSIEKNNEKVIAYSEKIELVIKGIKSKNFNISLKDLLKLYGKPIKTEKVSDECGVYLSELFYHYPDLDVSVDEKQNLVELVASRINQNNKLFIENSTLDNTTNEKDFIIKYGEYLDTFFKSPHIYYFSLDGGSISVEFKDGKLFQVGINFVC